MIKKRKSPRRSLKQRCLWFRSKVRMALQFEWRPLEDDEVKTFKIAVSILAGLIFIFSLTYLLSEKKPHISAIEPSIAVPGSEILIKGRYLRSGIEYDSIEFAGKIISLDKISKWEGRKIKLKVPERINSGMIYVLTRRGKSNGILFTNDNQIPRKKKMEHEASFYIESPNKISGKPGDLIQLRGSHFGQRKLNSKIFLISEGKEPLDLSQNFPLSIELWSDRQIDFRLPDFDFRGDLKISLDTDYFLTLPCEINLTGGVRKVGSEVVYSIRQQLTVIGNLKNEKRAKGVVIFPLAFNGYKQKLISVLSSEKNIVNSSSKSFINFSIPAGETNTIISHDMKVSALPLINELDPKLLKTSYDKSSHLYQYYTDLDSIEGDCSLLIKDIAKTLKTSKGSYSQLEYNYNYILERLQPEKLFNGTIVDAAKQRKGNSWHYSALLVALCRNQGVPARMKSGVILSDAIWLPIAWAEAYIEGYGWIPIDPWMADQQKESSQYPIREDKKSFYFGSIGEGRILFRSEKVAEEKCDFGFTPKWREKKSYLFQFTNFEYLFEAYGFLSQELALYKIDYSIISDQK